MVTGGPSCEAEKIGLCKVVWAYGSDVPVVENSVIHSSE